MAHLYGGAPAPYVATRAKVCERMGWTFREFDTTPAREVLGLLEVWRISDQYSEANF